MRLISKPVLCNYYVTYRCNATCGFCDIWEKPSPYVTPEAVEQNMRDLKKLGVKVIDFTGGEPLLHREMDTLLRIAKKYGMITTLTTNALLYPKWAERLKGLIDMLHFSLDSPDKAEHDTLRGVACFDFVLESIEKAKALGERPDIIFTVFNHNIHLIKRMYEEICLPNNLILILNPSFEYNQVEVGTGLQKKELDILSYWAKQKNIYINEAFIQLRLDGGNHTADPVCKAASSTLVISPENKLVLPCYHLGTDSFQIENNLFDLYHSKEVRAIIAQEGKLDACEGCTINCYMQPSFAVEINKYWFKAMPSTLKYSREKGTWKQLFR
ncbi:radical SAM protein [Cytophaga hutchinsonii]|uniref:Fe-S oxidoreductase, radical SAM superfamily n=1 Tax=Cytophaga hutchinsonii (strain ATCC 33406 / DSM 1761 / CIP 103989 / NBRC 15051 / NCIMB 9469 / D465) TaxID=269798 RepID=A0A6N4SV62_CYTH3|nr:radical SAM protein [Cytophaga hutchinsonii]ABG60302.1 Fe-S oxidoreductase, radical SAM superfamily [Cytophaga hutchinsonii ATCC 33406]SFX99243.1 Radical SAM superfamily enzyme, MoaA/NifB/PqqE/SkfB family [Cytophaga hutchinsonii ATCC 33406]